MSFLRHGRSIDPMEGQIRGGGQPPTPVIVSMSLRPAIPWRVALQQRSPLLYRLNSMLTDGVVAVNHHLMRGGEFSTGGMGNFQSALTFELIAHSAYLRQPEFDVVDLRTQDQCRMPSCLFVACPRMEPPQNEITGAQYKRGFHPDSSRCGGPTVLACADS